MAERQAAILFINMAKGFGGGEYQSEQLMKHVSGYEVFFLGKKSGKFIPHLKQANYPIKIITLWQAIKLVLTRRPVIIHALDGRGAHFAALLKKISGQTALITRRVSIPFRHKSSFRSYQSVDKLIGISHQVSEEMRAIHPDVRTIYGCIKPLKENTEFEEQYFSTNSYRLSVAHIGNLLKVKNFPMTIELARRFPSIHFFIVGSGELETELKTQASGIPNITFIPFNPYIGSVLKHMDVQLLPSSSEGMGFVILEGYSYQVPVIANKAGGIPEIVQQGETGFLIEDNRLEGYQDTLQFLLDNPSKLTEMKSNIHAYMQKMDFTASRMTKEYEEVYQELLNNA